MISVPLKSPLIRELRSSKWLIIVFEEQIRRPALPDRDCGLELLDTAHPFAFIQKQVQLAVVLGGG